METNTTNISYKDAGVDIAAGNLLVKKIKKLTQTTYTKNVLSTLGGFFSACEIPSGFVNPVLTSTTDGVGTKVCLAKQLNNNKTIGIDLVAMCVNDLIVGGSQPLFFLDYYANSKLDVAVAYEIIQGIVKGCKISGCALTGGESAEMPSLYNNGDYDLAGFCVGVVEKNKIIDGTKVQEGDLLIALASSGLHSNGYSLVRKILEVNNTDIHTTSLNENKLADLLIEPTRIYVKSILELIKRCNVHAIAHITGGGLIENIPRVLPQGLNAVIQSNTWDIPEIFKWLQQKGNVTTAQMQRTFNLGVGMIVCVAKEDSADVISYLEQVQEKAWVIGEVVAAQNNKDRLMFV